MPEIEPGLRGLNADRKRALHRLRTLKQTREQGWDGHWRAIATNLLPRHSRFLSNQRNRGGDRNQAIIDSAGTWALRTLAAGMMAGMTSPARPWFRLGLEDEEMQEAHSVKVWLDQVTKLMLRIFAKSNTYNTLHGMYRELGGFGTGFSMLEPDFDAVIHHNLMTVGQYALGTNHKGVVDKVGREFELTVEEACEWFGYDNLSASAKNAYDRSNYSKTVTVVHIVEPNTERDTNKRDNSNMPFRSVYWDNKDTDNGSEGRLRRGGYKFFPGLAPRWDLIWGDTYGNSPGMEALGDLIQLQHEQVKKAKVIDYRVDPPLQVPTSMRGAGDFLPGGVSYYDAMQPHAGVRAAFELDLDPAILLEDIRDVRERINRAFYADMFLMISEADKRMTATEVAERHEEKLLMLGPVLERLHNELLSPLIAHTFSRCVEAGILPPPPEELSEVELQVQYISMLAQAQRAIEVNSTDRLIGHIGMIVQGSQDVSVWDKFDKDKSVERYADQLGVDPDLIVADDKVALVRQSRAQAAAQAQAAEQANQMADSAAKLGTVQTGAMPNENAASDILNLFSGYQSPGGTEL